MSTSATAESATPIFDALVREIGLQWVEPAEDTGPAASAVDGPEPVTTGC